MSNIAISANHISKRFRVFNNQRSKVLHTILPKYQSGMQEVWALKDVSLEINRGEAVAIIGRNGSGKSTLLEILTGTLTATNGEVKVNGRISALLELGSGFNPEYSGRDNVILSGLLLGLNRKEILGRFEEVENFAEIGDAIDHPVKTYSSGMMMRLAFSVQILLKPDILIVDEALGVGDFFFQQKCFARLRKMQDEGLTLLFVSHDMGTVRDTCKRALYLRSGNPVFFGDTATAIRLYMTEGQSKFNADSKELLEITPLFFDNLATNAIWSRRPKENHRLMSVHVFDINQNAIDHAKLSETIRVQICYRTPPEEKPLAISLAIKNRYDQIVTTTNSQRMGVDSISKPNEQYAIFEFEVDLMLEAGLYSLRVNIGQPIDGNRGNMIDTTDWFGPFQIHWDYETQTAPFLGMFGLPARGRLK
jgi:lipopolysaccharide transport system ATP-binding protein